MPILKNDKISNGKEKTVYAKAGDQVKIIRDNQNVYIVENKKGNRFSVRKDELI